MSHLAIEAVCAGALSYQWQDKQPCPVLSSLQTKTSEIVQNAYSGRHCWFSAEKKILSMLLCTEVAETAADKQH